MAKTIRESVSLLKQMIANDNFKLPTIEEKNLKKFQSRRRFYEIQLSLLDLLEGSLDMEGI